MAWAGDWASRIAAPHRWRQPIPTGPERYQIVWIRVLLRDSVAFGASEHGDVNRSKLLGLFGLSHAFHCGGPGTPLAIQEATGRSISIGIQSHSRRAGNRGHRDGRDPQAQRP